MSIGCSIVAEAEPAVFRKPAPLEDNVSVIEEPVFGACAGHEKTDEAIGVMEWVSKRIWHILGHEYTLKDFEGPPAKSPEYKDGWVIVKNTVTDGGVPCRNQIITCEIEQMDEPLVVYVRSADAFGEIFIELDLRKGWARAHSVTINRTMIGGVSHSSPMPLEANDLIIKEDLFTPPAAGPVNLKILTRGERIALWANDQEIFRFQDPDPAGGKFGFGSHGNMRFRNVQQWELISAEEKKRREDCIREMSEFCRDIDAYYDNDVRQKNRIRTSEGGIDWFWPATGASVKLRVNGPRVEATIGAGLYGNDTLVDGVYPEIIVTAKNDVEYGPDPNGTAKITADDLSIRMELPLIAKGGKKATAHVLAKLSVQTVWFWTVTVDGVEAKSIQAWIGLAPDFAMEKKDLNKTADAMFGLASQKGKTVMKTNHKAGFYAKAIEPAHTVLGVSDTHPGALGISTTDAKLRFGTVILPAQPLNLVGFKKRMVHYIRYPEGPVQHWRRRPSYQEYPADVDLRRFAGHGCDAMVWHHTWIGSDTLDREGFMVNEAEMARAMKETHRLGMTAIGYLGVVPGRNSLLRYEDTCPLSGSDYGGYQKNWDLQDATFYHLNGRYVEFLPWWTDYMCKEYGLDGYYLDGGSFGSMVQGAVKGRYRPEDADLSLEELRHRIYYRVRKVLELNNAGYGLEPWSGLDWMINGFYDCMMIGESFQEAAPEFYRDGHNALMTGCMVKMYGMRESSQNPYNIAMAGVCMSDIQVCSGNGAWGDVLDDANTWKRVQPLWDLLDSIDWDHLVDARPWYAQELVSGDGFYAGNYTNARRAIVFLANKTEEKGVFTVKIDPAKLPEIGGKWMMRYCLGRTGEIGPLGDGVHKIELPALHDGPVAIELTAE